MDASYIVIITIIITIILAPLAYLFGYAVLGPFLFPK